MDSSKLIVAISLSLLLTFFGVRSAKALAGIEVRYEETRVSSAELTLYDHRDRSGSDSSHGPWDLYTPRSSSVRMGALAMIEGDKSFYAFGLSIESLTSRFLYLPEGSGTVGTSQPVPADFQVFTLRLFAGIGAGDGEVFHAKGRAMLLFGLSISSITIEERQKTPWSSFGYISPELSRQLGRKDDVDSTIDVGLNAAGAPLSVFGLGVGLETEDWIGASVRDDGSKEYEEDCDCYREKPAYKVDKRLKAPGGLPELVIELRLGAYVQVFCAKLSVGVMYKMMGIFSYDGSSAADYRGWYVGLTAVF
ncbi:MAG: hypothetical protein NUW37_00945 [Planctomycetes bacterium]|nr:hypothetical protein [Planctomycetota bacterium]